MKGNRSVDFAFPVGDTKKYVEKWSRALPWPFQHQELTEAQESGTEVDKRELTNVINHLHFMGAYLFVYLKHTKYQNGIFIKAYPGPCQGQDLTCRLSDENPPDLAMDAYDLSHLVIDDGQSMILVPAQMEIVDKKSLTVELPEKSYAVGKRQCRRYPCNDIDIDLVQEGFVAKGELVDFSPAAFRIKVKPEPGSSFRWLNSNELVDIHLRKGQQIYFSGMYRCVRQLHNPLNDEVVLAPVNAKIKRFREKEIQNPRQQLVPSPALVFNHPIINKRIQLEVAEISTSGFSVYEDADEGVLIPGMIIPELTVNYAATFKLQCIAQVVSRSEETKGSVKCELDILDMDIKTYNQLTNILSSALDPHAYVSTEVDMDALWEFFFHTGFIYGKKYGTIQSRKKDFKKTYKKLYQKCPEIAAHFTCQKNGRIYGHISMMRAYESTWMIQHHAARAMPGKRPAFMVLKQIIHYMNDVYHLPSAKVDYLMIYFRPENKFPDRVFGGFARHLKDPRGCSLDLFSYFPHTTLMLDTDLPEGWSLGGCSPMDLWELRCSYNHYSGGLALDALGFGQEDPGDESLEEIYRRLGFFRKRQAFSLTHEGRVNAVLLLDQSDPGLNLSELLNSIKILVMDPEDLPWKVLSIAVSQLIKQYRMEKVPIMIFPFDYVEAHRIPYEKQYQLWAFDASLVNQFIEYVQHKFHLSYYRG